MSNARYEHHLTSAHVRRNGGSKSQRSTQSQVKRKNGRLTSRSTVRVASTRPELRSGTAITVERTSEKPADTFSKFTNAHPPSELSLGESDLGFDWSRDVSSDF